MYLAGLPIPGPDVLELARLIDDQALTEKLETAYGRGARILALEIHERETLLRALDEPPSAALAELRAVLLQEHVVRVRDGLAQTTGPTAATIRRVSANVATVYLQGWELEKWQGEERREPPLELGNQVEWDLFPLTLELRNRLLELLGPNGGGAVSHLEAQQHRPGYDQPVATRGRITSIRVAYWKVRPIGEFVLEPAPGTAVFQERQILSAWDEWVVAGPADYRHGGFIVELTPMT